MARTKKAAKRKSSRRTYSPAPPAAADSKSYEYCALPVMPQRVFPSDMDAGRISLINSLTDKWVNGTVLHYYFFDQPTDGQTVFFSDGTSEFRTWTTNDAEKNVVRQAFARWKALGIGVDFQEVTSRTEAEIRVGFMRGDGAWSYIGRQILNIGTAKRTMNFGWDLTRHPDEVDTAVHEIGHTLGFPHEHQNPNAGIVWNEEAVYADLAAPPNSWTREKTFNNIIRKIDPDTVQGSNWDPDSIMHYPFKAGLIDQPVEHRNGLTPAGGISARDQTWVKTFYPPLQEADDTALLLLTSITLQLKEGEQRNFTIDPPATREYDIGTFGTSDSVIVLFENEGGNLRYRAGDDDSGEDRNAKLRIKLFKGRKYVLRVRLYYADRTGETAVMMW